MTVILLGLAKVILSFIFKRLSADEKSKLFNVEEEKEEKRAINAAEAYFLLVLKGNKKVKPLARTIDNMLMVIKKYSRNSHRQYERELKTFRHYADIEMKKFWDNHN